MFQTRPTLFTVLAATVLLAPSLCLAESEDNQAVRALFEREQDGWDTGNGAQILSCYDERYVQYEVPRWNDRPNFLLTQINTNRLYSGLKTVLLAEDFTGVAALVADTTLALERHREISHIDVAGTEGVAIATFHASWNHVASGERVEQGWQTMWLVRKIDGDWKYVAGIGGVDSHSASFPQP